MVSSIGNGLLSYLYHKAMSNESIFIVCWHHPVSLFGEIYSYFAASSSHISHTFLSHLDESWQQSQYQAEPLHRSSSLSLGTHEKKASIFTREIIALWKTKCRYTPSKNLFLATEPLKKLMVGTILFFSVVKSIFCNIEMDALVSTHCWILRRIWTISKPERNESILVFFSQILILLDLT